ncbi:MAG TPA: glycosyltransferase family 39 protein [Candidatus Binatus sp.]|uniref:glycosyltransferase family 39 protein n=1 Tax=Candidatus Binatus sp. TaxID=2811406 RepID=UPI002B466095|nr:glycosyltransferase family 39 protein [Candidatus Binatus sp.]HKN13203.1 glycosyltransferase family 39 protein [Candidatus Binatus sp.]
MTDGLRRRPVEIFAAIFVAAGITYAYHLGTDPLGASEAYSAWAAAKPGVGAIVRTPVLHDPGKQVFYYVVLHYYARIFGLSEISLRSMSVIFSLTTLVLVFALGCEMFDDNTALAATTMWAFNPLAVVFAHAARMYPMILTLALAQLLSLWRVRKRPSASLAVLCGIAGAALLYTHLGGILFIGAGVAMLVRDFIRGRRNPMAWLAMAITLALFVPYWPVAREQSETLIAGHWLDWIGTAYQYPLSIKIVLALGAAAIAAWFVFGATAESDRYDALRWLGAWTILPGLMLAAGSIVIRPMFNLRYIAPSTATLALLIAAGIAPVSVKWRNLTAAGFALACLIMVPYARTTPQPWRALAARVAAGGASEPVFFESGFVSSENAANVGNRGFPFGYYSVPFDYYFKGANPRVAIPGFDNAAARMTIEERVSSAGGGWLVSWKEGDAVNSELPDPKRFSVIEKFRGDRLAFYRITPIGK